MKLFFITLAPLQNNPGHLARLQLQLCKLSENAEISILCLHREKDDLFIQKKFYNVKFFHYPISTEGWYLKNKIATIKEITEIITQQNPDITVLQMESWELMLSLAKSLKDITTFATVVHAMPFLVSPLNPSKLFEQDVLEYASSGIEDFRKEFVLENYIYAKNTLTSLNLITANNTVSFYLKNYFPEIKLFEFIPQIKSEIKYKIINQKVKYDFVYMARMEKGKGIEYLKQILIKISTLLKRKVTILILGRTDDLFSKQALDDLISSQSSKTYSVEYLGWISNEIKNKLLSNCGVFLYPSHYDNFPSVINEALHYGLPVVLWNVIFTKMNFKDIRGVMLTELFDYNSFAENAVYCFKNRDKLRLNLLEYLNQLPAVDDVIHNDFYNIYFKLITKNEVNK